MSRTLTNHAARRGVVLTAVLTLFALFGFLPAVHAAPGEDVLPAAQAAPDDIDMTKNGQGSLVITKYTDPAWNTKADGSKQEIPEAAGNPLADVTFTLTPVNKDNVAIDLSKSTQWDETKGLKFTNGNVTNDAKSNLSLGTPVEKKTDQAGVATFSGLKFGVYLVQETKAPVNVTRKTEPFFVTIPFPNSDEVGGWLYTVYAYPKNGTSTFEKALDPNTKKDQYAAGDELVWKLTGQVPNDPNLAAFRLSDKLDPSLTYKPGETTAPVVTVEGRKLTVDQDYTVEFSQNTVYITFKDTFFKKNLGKTVNVDLATEIKSVPETNVIPNEGATLDFKNNPGGNWNSVPPKENPNANFGDYNIKKVAESQNGEALEGAVFRVYATREAAEKGGDDYVAESTPSNKAGLATIKDLFLGSNDDKSEKYYVRESVAPAGYILSDSVTEITVTDQTGKNDSDTGDISIVNKQHDGPDLPLTGATLGVVLPAAGVLLLVGAGIVLAVNKRREKDAA
ncbi:SpaH/EbpB family LPXTG-anchored major pilin [Arcanobacterium canis]|uniref:SpaH/EbpB family LPXTG-anchored major pilin n=1 Tax=Arcanobacterium canis TaxID=999183 RepID=A0ABY8G0U0_9ACTO|nr:SpaH/EbpB family LPXTG-anchored major pilin [Arcanobacterium canis]WFM83660.1 SpaH/EbpB family LPXTG-anchored major pilin [Arcanobacterium canis]